MTTTPSCGGPSSQVQAGREGLHWRAEVHAYTLTHLGPDAVPWPIMYLLVALRLCLHTHTHTKGCCMHVWAAARGSNHAMPPSCFWVGMPCIAHCSDLPLHHLPGVPPVRHTPISGQGCWLCWFAVYLWPAGPEDTPYSGGCFIFDMFFPPNYPNSAPKVLITTTGGGTVRVSHHVASVLQVW